MKKIVLGILIGITVLVLSGITTAQALVFTSAKVLPSGVTVTVPDIAVEKAKALGFEPGTLDKRVFIHYAKPGEKGAKTPTCYKLLGAKWKSLPVDYWVHPNVENRVPGAISNSAETWDMATSKELFNGYTVEESADWDIDYPDGRNEYSFGNYPEAGVIAVTVVWSGVPIGGRGRQIIEYDVMFDTDYTWGDAKANPAVMDLENIATHETGHGIGLADVYEETCSAVTMYGYSDYGEIDKRTLEQPDITGIQKLYGV